MKLVLFKSLLPNAYLNAGFYWLAERSDIPDLSNPNKKKQLVSEKAGTSADSSDVIGPSLPTEDDGLVETRMEWVIFTLYCLLTVMVGNRW